MKSKYFDLKKFKQSFDPPENLKILRKQTKPKKNHKVFLGYDNETESEQQQEISDKEKKRQKLVSKKVSKELIKSQEPSPKKNFKAKYDESSSNNEMNLFKELETSQRQRSFKTGREITEERQEQNFIGELNNYLKELKKSKLDLSEDPNSRNETLLLNKLSLRKTEKEEKTTENSSRLEKKIKREKSINRNLQKCIIEIQKVLWDRSDQLEILEEEIRRSVRERQNFLRKNSELDKNNLSKTIFFNQEFRNKNELMPKHQNRHIFYNQEENTNNKSSKLRSKEQPVSIFYKTNSETDQESEATFKQKPRRKTEATMNIEKVLEKTLDNKGLNRTKLLKTYNKFEREDLNDV